VCPGPGNSVPAGMVQSFAQAADDAERIGNVPVGKNGCGCWWSPRRRSSPRTATAASSKPRGAAPMPRWIAGQICTVLLLIKMMLLDFYHLSRHIHAAATCCLAKRRRPKTGPRRGSKKSRNSGQRRCWRHRHLAKKIRAPVKRKSLAGLRNYIIARLELLNYPLALARGYDIGSGPTEAMCKTLTLRLKRPA